MTEMRGYTWTVPILPPLDFVKVQVYAMSEEEARKLVLDAAIEYFKDSADYWLEMVTKYVSEEYPSIIESGLDVPIWTVVSPP